MCVICASDYAENVRATLRQHLAKSDTMLQKDLVMFLLGLMHNFRKKLRVFGMKIAQQSISCGDNCTPQ